MEVSILQELVHYLSPLIGFVGIIIIFVGVVRSLYEYIFIKGESCSLEARVTLNQHLILGLDFLVGKDIMDTFLLDAGSVQWIDLATLATVVTIRIVLSHFLEKEIKTIRNG